MPSSSCANHEVDALFDEYQNDLDAFSQFQASPSCVALTSLYGITEKEAAADPSNFYLVLSEGLKQSVKVHTPAWKAAYAARAKAPAVN
jgi:hypothetical protein